MITSKGGLSKGLQVPDVDMSSFFFQALLYLFSVWEKAKCGVWIQTSLTDVPHRLLVCLLVFFLFDFGRALVSYALI